MQPSPQPNIVIVVADDVTPAYHGCYGGRTPTPHIDRLAREGALFRRSCGVAPLCNPSRYSIFTGCYPGRAPSAHRGCSPDEPYSLNQNAELEPETPTLPKLLRAAGYFTGHVGKWHSNFSRLGEEWPEALGPEADLDLPETDRRLRRLHDSQRQVVQETAGFEWVEAINWGNLMGNRPKALRSHNPAWITDAALSFLRDPQRGGRPFYLHLANTVPHDPNSQESLGKDHRYTFNGKLPHPPQSHPEDATVLQRMRQAGIETEGPIAGINAGIIQIDDQIGAIIRQLEAMNELDRTIFVYTADHGVHGKGTCFMGGWHLPLVVRWPARIPAGREVREAVSHVDFLPTLAEAAGVGIPCGQTCDGVSWLPLAGGAEIRRRVTYQEMGVGRAVLKGNLHYIAFRQAESALRRMASGAAKEAIDLHPSGNSPFCNYNFVNKPHYFEPEQLYDIEADPHQRTNLARRPEFQDALAEMRAELMAITDTLPGPYRHDTPPFMESPAYQSLVEARRETVRRMSFYPDGFDQERVFNLNLPDPALRPR